MKRVGILGGMGPEATVLLMKKIIAGVKAEDDKYHIPLIVHQNTQVPSRIERILEGVGDDPIPTLQRMALDLEKMQCDFLAMPCNTAHFYYEQISRNLSVPILNMIDLSTQSLIGQQLSKIGILASPAVKKIGVFDTSFSKSHLSARYPEDDADMLNLIKKIKKGDLDKSAINDFKFQISRLLDEGCDGILIACTELSLLKKHVPKSITCLDSLDCLVDSIILNALD